MIVTITKATRRSVRSMPVLAASPAITPPTIPWRGSRRSRGDPAAALISSIVTILAAVDESAQQEDRPDRCRERNCDPTERDVECSGRVEQHERAEGGDH